MTREVHAAELTTFAIGGLKHPDLIALLILRGNPPENELRDGTQLLVVLRLSRGTQFGFAGRNPTRRSLA